jgi:hypothetical protein
MNELRLRWNGISLLFALFAEKAGKIFNFALGGFYALR